MSILPQNQGSIDTPTPPSQIVISSWNFLSATIMAPYKVKFHKIDKQVETEVQNWLSVYLFIKGKTPSNSTYRFHPKWFNLLRSPYSPSSFFDIVKRSLAHTINFDQTFQSCDLLMGLLRVFIWGEGGTSYITQGPKRAFCEVRNGSKVSRYPNYPRQTSKGSSHLVVRWALLTHQQVVTIPNNALKHKSHFFRLLFQHFQETLETNLATVLSDV